MFKPGEMLILDWLPPVMRGQSVRAWELASRPDGDWTVGLKMEILQSEQYYRLLVVTDIRRMRGRPDHVRKLVLDTAEADNAERQFVKILLPQDPAQAGAEQVESYTRDLRPRSLRECRRVAENCPLHRCTHRLGSRHSPTIKSVGSRLTAPRMADLGYVGN